MRPRRREELKVSVNTGAHGGHRAVLSASPPAMPAMAPHHHFRRLAQHVLARAARQRTIARPAAQCERQGQLPPGLCSTRCVSVPAHGAVLHSTSRSSAARSSLHFGRAARRADGARCAASSPSACTAPLCVSLARAASSAAPVLVPLCRLVALDQRKWSKVGVPLSAFGGAPTPFGYSRSWRRRGGSEPVLLLDEIVLVSSAPPRRAPSAGRSSAAAGPARASISRPRARAAAARPAAAAARRRQGRRRGGGGGGGAARPLCRVEDGDHLDGRWCRTARRRRSSGPTATRTAAAAAAVWGVGLPALTR